MHVSACLATFQSGKVLVSNQQNEHVRANLPSAGADFIKFRSGEEFLDGISAPWLAFPSEVYLLKDKTRDSLLLSDRLGSSSVMIMLLRAALGGRIHHGRLKSEG